MISWRVDRNGRLGLLQGWPVDWDARALLREVREVAGAAVENAPIYRVHPVSADHRAITKDNALKATPLEAQTTHE